MRANMKTRQTGAVLAISLIFLVVLTLLGITGAQNTIIEERMTSNFRDEQIALEAAEAAMKAGEKRLKVFAVFETMTWDGTAGTHEGVPSKDPFGTVASQTVSGISGIDGVASQNPTYYIERLDKILLHGSSVGVGFGPPPTMRYFRVTAKGWGKAVTTDPQVVLQSTFYRMD